MSQQKVVPLLLYIKVQQVFITVFIFLLWIKMDNT